MAQEYTVSKAFLGSVEGDKTTPQVIPTQAGNCHKYLVQVINQPKPGWMQILRKIGGDGNSMPVAGGDILYGSISENSWGKPEFKREQRPDGQPAVQSAAPAGAGTPARSQPAQAPQSSNSELEAKVDYIIGLLENFLNAHNGVEQTGVTKSVANNDGDEAPVNLDSLDY